MRLSRAMPTESRERAQKWFESLVGDDSPGGGIKETAGPYHGNELKRAPVVITLTHAIPGDATGGAPGASSTSTSRSPSTVPSASVSASASSPNVPPPTSTETAALGTASATPSLVSPSSASTSTTSPSTSPSLSISSPLDLASRTATPSSSSSSSSSSSRSSTEPFPQREGQGRAEADTVGRSAKDSGRITMVSIIFGSLVGLSVVVVTGIFIYKYRKRKKHLNKKMKEEK